MGFEIDFQILYLGIGLIGLILINVLLGSINAFLQKEFNKNKFFSGLIKGIIVCISFVGCIFIGQLNPDILVVNSNGQEIDLVTAINVLLISGYLWYTKEVLTKLAGFINAKF